ncbi:polysaccharide pyruvyl transferase family protein [Aerococcaceae bacterium WGS1372]
MEKVFIKAYTENNLGDDLFVYMLAKRYPNCEFLLPCPRKFRKPFQSLSNIRFVPIIPFIDGVLARLGLSLRVKRNYYRKLMAQCDATVHIGGSLFIEYMFPHAEIDQYLQDVQASQAYYLLGTNFGPYEHQSFYEKIHQLFTHIDDICVRDEYTYNLFNDIDQVRLAPDVVFGLEKGALTHQLKEKCVVISVIRLDGRPGLKHLQEIYEAKIQKLALELVRQNYEVVLMSFCQSEGDEEVVQRLASQLNHQVGTFAYKDNIEAALEIIAKAQGIVASRFHALILGWVFNCHVYPLNYSPKMTRVIEDMKFEGDYTEIQDIASLDVQLVVDQLLESSSIDIDHYARKAEEHFMQLDERLF